MSDGDSGPAAASSPEMLWTAVDRLLGAAAIEGIRIHKVGPLGARRLRRLGRPVPALLAADERAARGSMMITQPLLERIRASCDGPLVLFKGPEVACLYPDGARTFSDLDLLAPDARKTHHALTAAGFEEVDDPELFRDHHHLRPLKWPTLGLKVEIHDRPNWPAGSDAPSAAEIVAKAVSSQVGVDGISAPHPTHHALILAAHGWEHEPLGTVRDLIDVAVVARLSSDEELLRQAHAWSIARVWRTTRAAAAALFERERATVALRLWGRHLVSVRERTVLENHLQRWLHLFWALPPRAALAGMVDALREEVLPMPDEAWRDKLIRTAQGLRHPGAPRSVHTEAWREAARRSRQR